MNDDRISDRIAFGSCNEQDLQNNLWPIIESRQPTAFVWGGDAIYAGTFAVLCRLGENLSRFYVWYRYLLASYIFLSVSSPYSRHLAGTRLVFLSTESATSMRHSFPVAEALPNTTKCACLSEPIAPKSDSVWNF
jgi:hypothetical protein